MKSEGSLLPLTIDPERPPLLPSGALYTQTPLSMTSGNVFGNSNGHVVREEKRLDGGGPGRPRSGSAATAWIPPETRQEEGWRGKDVGAVT